MSPVEAGRLPAYHPASNTGTIYMTTTLALGEEFEAILRGLVDSGCYGDETEVVRKSLRLLAERDADLTARREELFASFDEAYDDVVKNGGMTIDEVDAHFNRRAEELAERLRS